MVSVYFEWRISSARGSESIAADIARHVHTRQHLGKTVVVCEQPVVMLSAVRKQWLKLSRTIQKQRASTLNADKILKYTHTITRMQHMRFTGQLPVENPEADLFFLNPADCSSIPIQTMTLYIMPKITTEEAATILGRLGGESLIVDYGHSGHWANLGLQPKSKLEENVLIEWQRTKDFLEQFSIQPKVLFRGTSHNLEAMEDALDTLLNVSTRFLQIANSFQHAMEIARPLKTPKELRQQYDSVILLAHRVQALSPGAFTQRFLESYNEDDTFFLYDSLRHFTNGGTEPLEAVIARHRIAGRNTLADALLHTAFTTRHPR